MDQNYQNINEWIHNYYYYPFTNQPLYHYVESANQQPPGLSFGTQEGPSINAGPQMKKDQAFKNQIDIKIEEGPRVDEIQEAQEGKKGSPKKKKWQNSNKNKNIFPNTINRMISYLSCRARSNKVLEKFIEKNEHISQYVTSKTYSSYIKLLKPQMNRCLMEETVQKLFQYSDPDFKIFTKEQQQCFIRINAFLFSYYARSPTHVLYLVHSNCLQKDNIPDYIRADREILKRIQELFRNSQLYVRLRNQRKRK